MKELEWAKQEIKLACKNTKDITEDPFGYKYACLCYKSAFKAFKKAIKSLDEDGHSGFSFWTTVNVLKKLLDHKPLTPIENNDADWIPYSFNLNDEPSNRTSYSHKRLSSLTKVVYENGDEKISDTNRICCIDSETGVTYRSNMINKIIDDLYPISFPYIAETLFVYCEDFLYNTDKGDFDTVGILYLKNGNKDVIDVNIYLKEDPEQGWIQITREEYMDRKTNKNKGVVKC